MSSYEFSLVHWLSCVKCKYRCYDKCHAFTYFSSFFLFPFPNIWKQSSKAAAAKGQEIPGLPPIHKLPKRPPHLPCAPVACHVQNARHGTKTSVRTSTGIAGVQLSAPWLHPLHPQLEAATCDTVLNPEGELMWITIELPYYDSWLFCIYEGLKSMDCMKPIHQNALVGLRPSRLVLGEARVRQWQSSRTQMLLATT